MRIVEHARRQRLGTRMLEAIAEWLGDRECYCVPYPHLVGFYGQIGFIVLEPTAAPAFLAERVAEYRRSGQEVDPHAQAADAALRRTSVPNATAFVKKLKDDLG